MDHPIVVVCDSPTQVEALSGKLFTGYSGQVLSAIMQARGIDEKDLVKLSLMDRPLKRDEKILTSTISEYREELLFKLHALQPRLVILCGAGCISAIAGTKGPQVTHGKKGYNTYLDCVTVNTFNPGACFFEPDRLRDIDLDLRHIATYERGRNTVFLPELPWVLFDSNTPLADINRFFTRAQNLYKTEAILGVLDIETTGLDPVKNEIISVGISLTEDENYIITDACIRKHKVTFTNFLQDRYLKWVGQNIYQFDSKFLLVHYNIDWRANYDTMLEHYSLDERQEGHGLKYLAQQYYDAPAWDPDIDWDNAANFTEEYLRSDVYPYQVYDLYYTRKVHHQLWDEMDKQEGLQDLHDKVLIPGAWALGRMELNGITVNTTYLEGLRGTLEGQYQTALSEIREESGIPNFNVNSPKQVKDLLIHTLRLAPKTSGTGVKDLDQMDHPLASKIKDCRIKAKLVSTYVDGILKRVDDTGRIHSDFCLWGTSTGRLSSRNPNLQNLPVVSGKDIKRAFVPRPGFKFLNADYSQLEFRVIGWLSGDLYLKKAYTEGIDLHKLVASAMYQRPPETITFHERFTAKLTGFGILYGRTAPSLARDSLHCSVEVAEGFMRNFLERFDKLGDFITGQHKSVVELGYTTTAFGRRRRFPVITKETLHAIQRQSVNSPTQGTASDLTLTALARITARIYSEFPEGTLQPLLTVHDSIGFEVHPSVLVQAVNLIYEEMVVNVPLENRIPWGVSMEIGDNYGDLEEFDWEAMLTHEVT